MKCYPADVARRVEELIEAVASLEVYHKAPELREEAIKLLRIVRGEES